LPLINLFQKESIKVEVCKTIVEGLNKQNNPIIDLITINALMFIMKIMHDSVRYIFFNNIKFNTNSSFHIY
jgi:dethiobiotin synthetase